MAPTRSERRHRGEVISLRRSEFFLKHCDGGDWYKVKGRFRKSNGSCNCYMCKPNKQKSRKKDMIKAKHFAIKEDTEY